MRGHPSPETTRSRLRRGQRFLSAAPPEGISLNGTQCLPLLATEDLAAVAAELTGG